MGGKSEAGALVAGRGERAETAEPKAMTPRLRHERELGEFLRSRVVKA